MRKIISLYGIATIGMALICFAPAFCAPPIRCVHQTTVVKDGKVTTHLIMTTARPGAVQTVKNTANVVFSGSGRPRPYWQPPYREEFEVVANKDSTVAAVHLDAGTRAPDNNFCPIYLFLSSVNQGLKVIPNFDARLSQFLAVKPVRHNDGTQSPLHFWTPRQLYVMAITGRTLQIRIGAAEVTEGTVEVTVAEDGNLSLVGYQEEGE